MSCRWKYQIPHPDNVCLDCDVLAPEKCVDHGPHTGHQVVLREYGDGSYRYFCETCDLWAWKGDRTL